VCVDAAPQLFDVKEGSPEGVREGARLGGDNLRWSNREVTRKRDNIHMSAWTGIDLSSRFSRGSHMDSTDVPSVRAAGGPAFEKSLISLCSFAYRSSDAIHKHDIRAPKDVSFAERVVLASGTSRAGRPTWSQSDKQGRREGKRGDEAWIRTL
jgi:hypothetical protein